MIRLADYSLILIDVSKNSLVAFVGIGRRDIERAERHGAGGFVGHQLLDPVPLIALVVLVEARNPGLQRIQARLDIFSGMKVATMPSTCALRARPPSGALPFR